MTKIDEQFEFRKANAFNFIQTQIIRERRDREKKNLYYTTHFHAAFEALLKKEFASAKQSCKLLKKSCFKWLLYKEFQFYCKTLKKELPENELLAFVFGVPEKKFEKFVLKVHEKLPVNRFAEKTYREFLDFKKNEQQYETLPIKHIAVCATMSAGKSTFVNALLGLDVLPARAEATTAKITSVYDKDGAKNLLGFVQKKNEVADRCLHANLETINDWNDSNDVERIFLQGDLDGIGNRGIIVAVHDTPGTNNSEDKSHHDVTMDFLSSQKLDALIFVANAEHLCTTDEKALLTEIFEKTVKPKNLPIIFVLNKADKLDSEKEDISQIIKNYGEYLWKIGFESAKIFPLSSKAARLLKMVKNGRVENLTGKEKKELKAIQAEFPDFNSTGLPQVEIYIEQILGGEND